MQRVNKILDTKYEKANLEEVVAVYIWLAEEERGKLLNLLKKFPELFDGTLGTWKNETLSIQLKPGVKPYHARSFPIPKCYELTLKQEVERLVQLGVLKKVNRSEWAAPTFIILKKMVLSDFYLIFAN